MVWDGTLIDGHNRYAIAEKYVLFFETISKEFENNEETINWIIDNQLGRRNITLTQRDYLLGLRYRREKKSHGGDRKTKQSRGQNVPLITTVETITQQHGVSEKTVKRAEKFSAGLDNIAKSKPEIKQGVSKLIT